ncbi:MAG TPA: cytochrome c family protein [Magnetovibrio sp.]
MLKNILGSIVFTVAVFALVNLIGNMMVNPATAPHQVNVQVAAVQPEAAPAPATATATASAAAPEPAQAAAQAVAAAAPAVDEVALGSNLFRKKCLGCHTVGKGDANRTGPNLWAIVGRAKGSSEGYRYSKNMNALGGVWSEEDISAFIAGPRTFLPDTKMTFAGLKSESDRANVLAYLKTLKD